MMTELATNQPTPERDKLWDDRVDNVERRMLQFLPLIDQPLTHTFIGPLYVRYIINPVESLVSTKIHKTAHPFFVLRGVAAVSSNDGPPIEIHAPHFGITQPGTRRLILALEEVHWVTVHHMIEAEMAEPDISRRIAMIEERIIERRELAPGRTAHELFNQFLGLPPSARNLEIPEAP